MAALVGVALGVFGLPVPSWVPFAQRPAAAAVELFDDFNDNAPDASKWRGFVTGAGATVQETNQRLEVAVAADAQQGADSHFWAGYVSRCRLRGDFDIWVHYRLLGWPAENGVRVQLVAEVLEPGTPYNYFTQEADTIHTAERINWGPSELKVPGPDVYAANFTNTLAGQTSTSDQSAIMRLQRVGTTATAAYYNSTGWQTIRSGDITAADVDFLIRAGARDEFFGDKAVSIAFDNVRIQGTLICAGGPAEGQTYGTGSIDAINPTGTQADPVNSLTGSYTTSVTDAALPGIGVPFRLTRTYNSADTSTGALGRGWTHNLATSLDIKSYGDVLLRSDDGQQVLYTGQPNCTFAGPAGTRSRLTAITDTDASGYRALVMADAPRAYWRLAETSGATAADETANDLDGSYVGGATFGQTGIPGNPGTAVRFDGADDHVTALDAVDSTAYTLEAWVKLNSTADQAIITRTDNQGPAVTWSHQLRVSGGRFQHYLVDGAQRSVTGATPVEMGVWYHVVGTASNAGAMHLYVDGVEEGVAVPVNTLWTGGDRWHIASNSGHGMGYLNAIVDEVAVYPQVLSEAQIAAHHRGGRCGLTYELLRRNQTRLRFDASGKLMSVKDRNGQGLSLAYDGSARLATITDSAGRTISFMHNPAGRLTQVSLPGGRSVGYSYTDGLLSGVTDLRGGTIAYTYDTSGRLTKVIDQNLNTTIENIYGSDGRVMEQIDALGNHSFFAWNVSTGTATMTDARANQWKDVYTNGALIKRIDALGSEARYTYDADLNPTQLVDARGNTWGFEYDAAGNLTRRISPSPFTFDEEFTYDAQNNLTSFTNGRGHTITYEYDASGNLTKVTPPATILTQYTRNPSTGLVTAVTDPRGKTTSFGYDTAGNLTEITTPLGHKTTFDYDSSGRLTSLVDARGNETGATPSDFTWTFTYDAADNLLTQTDPLGNTTTFTYDPTGDLKSRADANIHATSYDYNAAGELTKVTAPDLTTTSYTYDAVGNPTSRTDALLRITSFDYDAANRRTKITSPLAQIWTYSYDAAGNLTSVTDAAGNVTPAPGDGNTTFAYDALNRLTSIDYSDATPDVSYTYDNAGNRTQMVDGAGTENQTADALSRSTAITRGADTFAYEYDQAGNVTSRAYPDSSVIDYTYDDDGRLKTVTNGGKTTTYTYDAAGNLAQTSLPNGVVETRAYDRAGRLTEVQSQKAGSAVSLARFVLDPVGNPLTITTRDGATTYDYDNRDRLIEACFAPGCTGLGDPFARYTYDAVGNRLTEQRASGTTTYTYNAGDQLLSQAGPGGTIVHAYDPNGNQITAGTRTFTYDLANRLTSITDPIAAGLVTAHTYTYDGDGRRLRERKTVGGVIEHEIQTLWDRNWSLDQLALEREADGNIRRRYVHGFDLISMTSNGTPSYYHHDGLGSVQSITDPDGALQWSYAYDAFGSLRRKTRHSVFAPENRMRFTGEAIDLATGLYHLRARQYDPAIGRFNRPDPLPSILGESAIASYAYVANRPTLLVDPSGLRGEPRNGGGPGIGSILWEAFINPIESFQAGVPLVPTWFWIADGAVILVSGGFVVCYFLSATCFAVGSTVVAGGSQVANGPIANQVPASLYQQIAMRAAQSGQVGEVIIEKLGDAPRLIANYGPGPWVKMQYALRTSDGRVAAVVHWFRNLVTGQDVEFKFTQ